MTQDSVSAIPDRLDSYAEGATAMDAELLSTTASMRNRLEHFQARCTEPGFTVHASGLVDPVRSLAHECDTVDKQVGEVGGRFRMADSRWSDHGGSWHLSAFGALWSTIAEWVPAFVLGGFWSVGTMRVPSWLIGVLPRLPWVQRIWRDGVSSGPGSESLPTGTSRLGELLDSDPAAEAERHVDSQPQGRSRLGELLAEENEGESPGGTSAAPKEVPEQSGQGGPPARAENVPAYDDEIETYQRGPYSNCTWYATAAVKSFSGDTINIGGARSLGGAGSWAGNAREAERDPDHPYHDYIAGVDKTPAIGSVYCKGNHVAFVEEVELMEEDGKKKWKITLSEENYYWQSGVFSGSNELDVPNYPEVRRWRREITIVEGEDDVGEFIHFNY